MPNRLVITESLPPGTYDLVPIDNPVPEPPIVVPPTPPQGPWLSVRRSSGDTKQLLVGGASFSAGPLLIALEGVSDGPVKFYINGNLHRTETNAPFDFNGGTASAPTPWDAPVGSYTVDADFPGGMVSVPFTVT